MNPNKILLLMAAVFFLIFPTSSLAEDQAHDAIMILLDGSGSMDRNMPDPSGKGVARKMDVAKDALKAVAPQIPSGTHVGLMVFNNQGIQVVYPIGPLDTALFNQRVSEICAGGGTPLGKGIRDAGRLLLREREAQHNVGTYKLLVVTDGEAEDEGSMRQSANELVSRLGLRMDVIGVAMAENHTLSSMAYSYQKADDSVALEVSLKKVLVVEAGADAPIDFSDTEPVPHEVAAVWVAALTEAPPNYWKGEEPREQMPRLGGGSTSGHAAPPGSEPSGCNSAGDISLKGTVGLLGFLALIAVLTRRNDSEPPRRRLAPVRVRRL